MSFKIAYMKFCISQLRFGGRDRFLCKYVSLEIKLFLLAILVHLTRGKLWPADAGPEGGDYLSSCELEQFLESQRKKPHHNQTPKMDLKTEIKMKSVYILAIKIEQLKLIFFL